MSGIEHDLNKLIRKAITDNLRQMRTGETSKRILFNDYALNWFELQQAVISYSTFRGYGTCLNSHILPFFKAKFLDSVIPSDIRSFVAFMYNNGSSSKTIRNNVSIISTILSFAIQDDIIIRNPCLGVKIPKSNKHEQEPFTAQEMLAIMRESDIRFPYMSLFFAFGFYAGLRTGEIMGLQWQDIDLNTNKIIIRRTISNGKLKNSTKTYQSRRIDIIPNLKSYILNHEKLDDTWLFIIYRNTNLISYNTVTYFYWRPILKNLGLKLRRVYNMRHTFTVLMLEAGEDINWIRNMLGHADITMITKYYGNRYTGVNFCGNKFSKLLENAINSSDIKGL